jgi:ElaB/YqjD/DUF883 family membrane-anchored ribosome-binding protein
MTARDRLNNEKEADVERSSEDIRQDIAKGKEDISHKVDQIGERIKEKLDWREYVKDSPYWAMGAAAGLGYIASRVLITRTTPLERIMRPIAEEVRDSLGGLVGGSARPGLIKVTLIGIATKAAIGWIKNATSKEVAGCGGPRPQTGRGTGSTGSQRLDKQPVVKMNHEH